MFPLKLLRVSESWVHRNPNKPQDCLVQNWLRITKRRDERQGEDNHLLETAFRRLLLWHGPDGSDPKGLLSLGMVTLIGAAWDSACSGFLSGRHRPRPGTTAILKRRFSLIFKSVVSQGKKMLWTLLTGPKERERTPAFPKIFLLSLFDSDSSEAKTNVFPILQHLAASSAPLKTVLDAVNPGIFKICSGAKCSQLDSLEPLLCST